MREIASDLKERDIIRSSLFFEFLVRLLSEDTGVRAGTYFFENGVFSLDLAKHLTRGIFGLDPTRVLIPEGATTREIALVMQHKFPDFDATRFLELAKDKEGYLFPDTYFFLPNTKPEQVIQEMRSNFDRQMADLLDDIASSTKSLHEIVTLASLLEKEAIVSRERKIISGIIQNRLDIDMPLQIDATFRYILGKGSFDLTREDLRHESPYNTYINKGLPPGPIANPGMDSILAAMHPEKTSYFYYLHDRRGRIFYSKDFEGHKRNKFAYLR